MYHEIEGLLRRGVEDHERGHPDRLAIHEELMGVHHLNVGDVRVRDRDLARRFVQGEKKGLVRAHVEAKCGVGSPGGHRLKQAAADDSDGHECRRTPEELAEAMCDHDWPPRLNLIHFFPCSAHPSRPWRTKSCSLTLEPRMTSTAYLSMVGNGRGALRTTVAFGFAWGAAIAASDKREDGVAP